MTLEQWVLAASRYCSGNTPNHEVWTLARKAMETRSCLMHASHLLALERAKACPICGGPITDRRIEAHNLCRARRERGLPTPRLPAPDCLCEACQKGAQP